MTRRSTSCSTWPAGLAVEAGDAGAGAGATIGGRCTARRRSRRRPTSSPTTTARPRRRSSPASRAARPDDAIVGEEGTDRPGTSGDRRGSSTRSTARRTSSTTCPLWSTSVAAGDADGMLAGAVYVPGARRAVRRRPRAAAPRSTGGRSAAATATDLALALVATGFAYHRDAPARAGRRRRRGSSAHVRDIRRLGSAAIDLCYVAAGRVRRLLRDRPQRVGRRRRRADRPRGRLPHRRLPPAARRRPASCSSPTPGHLRRPGRAARRD